MTPMPEPSTTEPKVRADDRDVLRWLAFVASYPMPVTFASCEEEEACHA